MQNSPIEIFNEALKKEKKGKFEDALKLYSRILANHQGHFESWLNSGTIYSRIRQYEKAIKCYEQALKIRKDSRATYNIGLAYYKQKKLSEALGYFINCLELNPDFLQGYLLTGYVYIELSKTSDAIDIINRALGKFQNNISLLICLAIAYNASGKEDECNHLIEHILKLDPEHVVALRLKARLSISKNVTREGIENFRKFIHTDRDIMELEAFMERPENAQVKDVISNKKEQLLKKTMKSNQDYLDLSLMSILSGNGNAALNYLLYATRDK